MTTTYKDLRYILPGETHRTVILETGRKKLTIVTSIGGWMDELVCTSNIWVESPGLWGGTDCRTFNLSDFTAAVKYYVDCRKA